MQYDLFITHAWRYHDDWNQLSELLNAHPGLEWRNFSVPWYDPAMDPNTPVGYKFVTHWLEGQIIPCTAVLFLSGVYALKSTRKWLDMEVEMARRHGKPIIGVPHSETGEFLEEARPLVDEVTTWDAAAIIARVDARAGAASPA